MARKEESPSHGRRHAPAPMLASAASGRLDAIDILRGAAICGMVLFHVDWDLADWGWIETGPADSPAWMLFGHVIAATFLFVSGFCLVLAGPRGTAAALRRIARLAGAAILVSAVTLWLFPADYIFFGILHVIALSNLVGLAFIRAPIGLTLVTALLATLAPRILASPSFDHAAFWWLGLSTSVPATLDYRPMLPWLGATLLGIAAARLVPRPPMIRQRARWSRGLAWAGRHALSIYLLHQPLLFGLFVLLATIHPAAPPDQKASFSRQCRAQCLAAGAGRAGCDAACDCVLNRIGGRLDAGSADPAPAESELDAASRSCVGADPSRPRSKTSGIGDRP